MHCLFTGFDPFDYSKTNPSQQAVERLPDKLMLRDGTEVQVHKAVLPTCCDDAWEALQKAVDAIPAGEPFALVMSGLAGERARISLEWFALNMRDYRVADNRSHQWSHEPIVPGAPDAFHAKAELRAIMFKIEDKGMRASLSYHAGTFVCNETYYRALHKWGEDERCVGVLFMHLPSLENYAAWLGVKEDEKAEKRREEQTPEEIEQVRALVLEHYAAALEEGAKFMCEKRAGKRATV